jgi:hypothetical protein
MGQAPLLALAVLGVSIGAELRTLIILDRDTLSRLLDQGRRTTLIAPSSFF